MLKDFQLVNNNIIQVNENLQQIIIYIIKQKVKLEHQNKITEKKNEFMSLLNIILNINTFILSFVSFNSNLILVSYIVIGLTFLCSVCSILSKILNFSKKNGEYSTYLDECDEALNEYKQYLLINNEEDNVNMNINISDNDKNKIKTLSDCQNNNISNILDNNKQKSINSSFSEIEENKNNINLKNKVPSIIKILSGYEKILKINNKYKNEQLNVNKFNNYIDNIDDNKILNKIDSIINNIDVNNIKEIMKEIDNSPNIIYNNENLNILNDKLKNCVIKEEENESFYESTNFTKIDINKNINNEEVNLEDISVLFEEKKNEI